MGIPSVRRDVHSYLTDALHSLISELSPQEEEDSVIVVLIAETDPQYTSLVTETIKALFPTEIHSGLLEASPLLPTSTLSSPASESPLGTPRRESGGRPNRTLITASS